MAAASKHESDIALWIEKVIDSCTTPLQEMTARNLIRQFEEKLSREESPSYWYYSRILNDKLDFLYYDRLNKLK